MHNQLTRLDSRTPPDEIIRGALRADADGKALIEVALPAQAISIQGTAERYSHGKTPHSLHVWWARRPLSSMRALVFAALARIHHDCDVQELFELCRALAQFEPDPVGAISSARQVIGQNKIVLDLFGGGGSIPFEAARLGCQAISIELNPLAVFVQKTLLNYSQYVDNLPVLVRSYGTQLIKQLESDTEALFPHRRQPDETVAYFWVRAMPCPNEACGAHLPVRRIVPLKSRNGQCIYAAIEPSRTMQSFSAQIIHSDHFPANAEHLWDTCPQCGHTLQGRNLQNGTPPSIMPVAKCGLGPQGKSYTPYIGDDLAFDTLIEQELGHIGGLPATEMPRWSGITNPTLYGISRHSDLFTPRQLLILLHVIRGLRALYRDIQQEQGDAVAKPVVACLSGLIDQLVDWNSSFSVWLPTNEQVGRSLAGPGLPMQWTCAEIDPFGHGPANLWDKLDRIVKACQAIPHFDLEPWVMSGSATQIDLPNSSIDAIVTDPPYADNLYYSILSDCIYTWKRLCLHDIFLQDFRLAMAPTESEIVASARRQGDSQKAMLFYHDHLKAALSEGYRVLKPAGTLGLVFTHSTLEGWATVFSAILGAGFRIVACWPFRIERKARPRGLAKGAVHASCVIAAVKTPAGSQPSKQIEEGQLSRLRDALEKEGWSQGEIGLALFVQRAAGVLQSSTIHDPEKIQATVEKCYRHVRKSVPEFNLKSRNML